MPNIENNTESLHEILESLKGKADGGAEAERSRFWDINQNYGKRADYSYSYAWGAYTDENFHPKYRIGTDTDCNLNGCFWGAKTLTRIPQNIRSHSWTNMTNTFKNCNALVEVRFDGVIGNSISFAESSLLSKESVESVISHLYDSASGKTATFNSASRNKFTDAEWNSLIATKPNWTISLA